MVFSTKSHHNHSKSLLLQSPSKSFSVTPSTHKKLSKTPKEKRRSSKTDLTSPSLSVGSSLWYTTTTNNDDSTSNQSLTNTSPIFELTQEV